MSIERPSPHRSDARPSAIVVFTLTLLLTSATACSDAESPLEPNDDDAVTPPTNLPNLILRLDLNSVTDYTAVAWPAHYDQNVRARDNAPNDNPVTNAGAELGRVLFYDPRLSVNSTISCASCHAQSVGFGDDRRFSVGFEGGETGAHSMRLGNANFYEGDEMFWDRRADDLEEQVVLPIQDGVEMGFTPAAGGLGAVVARLETIDYYPVLFQRAFGSSQVTEQGLSRALAQFVRAMVSTDSRFDRAFAQVPMQGGGPPTGLPGFTAEENLGFRLFTRPPNQGGAGCDACHRLPTFALDPNSRSNGLDEGETRIFKSPSLKNVAVGSAFMHDGRFRTLREVVDFYDGGIQPGPALDRRLTEPGGQPMRLGLSAAERDALVAFLETLTDESLAADDRFSDPFVPQPGG